MNAYAVISCGQLWVAMGYEQLCGAVGSYVIFQVSVDILPGVQQAGIGRYVQLYECVTICSYMTYRVMASIGIYGQLLVPMAMQELREFVVWSE